MICRLHRATPLVLVLLLQPTPARAGDPASTFSIDARPAALGNTGAVIPDPSLSGFHNPASAALGEGISIKVGYLFARPLLRLAGQDHFVDDVHGMNLGLRIPLLDRRVDGKRLRAALGLSLFVPDGWISRVYLIEPTRPSFVMWEGHVNRIVVTPVLALGVDELISVGLGVTLLADGRGQADLDLGFEGSQTRTDADLDLDLQLRAAPVVGIFLKPLPWITLSGGYSGELSMNLDLEVRAEIHAPGLTGRTLVSIHGTNDYTPPSAWFGAVVHPASWLDVMLQARYVMWHRANPFFAKLRMLVDLGVDPALLEGLAPDHELDDTWVLASGVEGRFAVLGGCEISPRLGYQFRPTPVPDQTGFTSYVDSDVHLFTTGLGFGTWKDRKVRMRVSWALQLHRIVYRRTVKDPDVFHLTGYGSQGWVVATMLDLTLTF